MLRCRVPSKYFAARAELNDDVMRVAKLPSLSLYVISVGSSLFTPSRRRYFGYVHSHCKATVFGAQMYVISR